MSVWYSHIFKPTVDVDRIAAMYEASSRAWCAPKTHPTTTRLRLIDYDKIYRESKSAELVPCGCELDGENTSDGSVESIKKMLFQESDNNLNFVCSCKCGHLKGNYWREFICPICKTECRDAFADEIIYRAWLEIPDFMPPLLHPAAYRVLGAWMGCVKRKKKIIDLLLDVDSELPEPYASVLGQGPGYFYRNFDHIIEYFLKQNTGVKEKRNRFIREFIEAHRHLLFVRHVPVLNQALHILTKSGTLTYNDEASTCILETCIELGNAIYSYRHNPSTNQHYLEQFNYAVYKSYLNYVEKINKIKLVSKYGFIRKSLLASRLNMTFRCVIVPLVVPHMPDEVHIPWKVAVTENKLEIYNFLTRVYRKSVQEAMRIISRAQVKYDNLVHDILLTLLEECPYRGFPILLGRNPTLRHGVIAPFLAISRIDHVTNCWQFPKPCSLAS